MSIWGWIKCYLGVGSEEDDLMDERFSSMMSIAYLRQLKERDEDDHESVRILTNYKDKDYKFFEMGSAEYNGKKYVILAPLHSFSGFDDEEELVYEMSQENGNPIEFKLTVESNTVSGVYQAYENTL